MKEYFLIGFKTTIGKRGYKFLDKIISENLKKAIKEFRERNNTNKLLKKYDLIISEAKI